MDDFAGRRREFMLPDMDSTFRVFAAHWRTVDSDWTYSSHEHPLFEVNMVLSGLQEMNVEGRVYEQKPGDLVLLNPGERHESRVLGSEEMTYYCLHFDVDEPAFRELMYRNKRCFHEQGSPLANAIQPALDKLIDLTSEEAAARIESRMRVLSALFELFAGISGILSEQAGDERPLPAAGTAARVAAMLEQAVEELAEGNGKGSKGETVAAAAAMVGYSPSSVNRMFTSAYGVPPRQYLSGLMLKKAKLLLLDPELTIETISSRLGYSNIAHFSRQFKRWSGEAPSSFRQRFHQ